MKILLPVDGSSFTKRMLAWLATHGEWLSGAHHYTFVNVVPQIPPHAAAMFQRDDLKNYYEDTAEGVFKALRKFASKHDMSATFVGKTGNAAETIAKMADKGKFDLVIMGSHGHGNLMNLVTGSVVTQVLAQCKTPVLLVR